MPLPNSEFLGSEDDIFPQPGPQLEFLSTRANIAGYGGSAGGGKTYALLLDAMRNVAVPAYEGVIFRRTMEQVRTAGGLWDESSNLYPIVGGVPREQQADWRFPKGGKVRFEHLQHERDKIQYQGAQIAFMGFDELTHFTESQFFYMLSRNRSTCGVIPYIRCTFNPDAQSWVKRFFAPWVDSQYEDKAASGEIRHFIRKGDQIVWVPAGTPNSKSVTFVRSSIHDNKILLSKDPCYLASLMAMAYVDRRRLLDGDWDIVEGGNMFRREWFGVPVDAAPATMRLCRYWDLAASEADEPGKDPDWTAGVLMGRDIRGIFYVVDVLRLRATPLNVESLITQTAALDRAMWGQVAIRMEQEPGSSGVNTIAHYNRLLAGYDFAPNKTTGSKATRAKPLSAQVEAGNVKIKSAPWNNEFLNECAAFPPLSGHDDQVDAASGALEELAFGVPFTGAVGGEQRSPDGSPFGANPRIDLSGFR